MRTYRLPSPDRTGWLLGLGPERVVPVGIGLVLSILVLGASSSVALAAVPMTVGLALASVRPGGRPLTELIPAAVAFAIRRHHRRFSAPLVPPPLATTALPHPLDRQRAEGRRDAAPGVPRPVLATRRCPGRVDE